MTILLYKLLLGFGAGSLIGFFSYLLHLLTKSGLFAVIIVGTLICGFGSWLTWGLILLFFFSSGCIHLGKKLLHLTKIDKVSEKNHTRDAWQVLANSIPAICSLLLFYWSNNQLFLVGYVSGLAGATADTWASEIGLLSKTAPRKIGSFHPIQAGLSGGVSWIGTMASILGSLLIVSVFGFFYHTQLSSSFWLIVPFLCGIFNSLIDSVLGATLQVTYRCSVCGQLTEKRHHHRQPTNQISGLSWLTNDGVNFISGVLTISLSWLLLALNKG